MSQAIHFWAVVEDVVRHSTDMASYRLHAKQKLPRVRPGQFIQLSIEPYVAGSFWPESRAFSIANAVADRHTLDLTISRQGTYTSRILKEVKAGATVWGKGPYGEFCIDRSMGGSAILIAGGSGITPFCAIMDAALTGGTLSMDSVKLYYGARSTSLLVHRPLADRCAARFPGFQVKYFAEMIEEPGDVRQGPIDLNEILAASQPEPGTKFFLSGPRKMIDAFRQRLVCEFGIPNDCVLSDDWE